MGSEAGFCEDGERSETVGGANLSPTAGPGSEPAAKHPTVTRAPLPGNDAGEGLTHSVGRAVDREPRGLGSNSGSIMNELCGPTRARSHVLGDLVLHPTGLSPSTPRFREG